MQFGTKKIIFIFFLIIFLILIFFYKFINNSIKINIHLKSPFLAEVHYLYSLKFIDDQKNFPKKEFDKIKKKTLYFVKEYKKKFSKNYKKQSYINNIELKPFIDSFNNTYFVFSIFTDDLKNKEKIEEFISNELVKLNNEFSVFTSNIIINHKYFSENYVATIEIFKKKYSEERNNEIMEKIENLDTVSNINLADFNLVYSFNVNVLSKGIQNIVVFLYIILLIFTFNILRQKLGKVKNIR